MVEGSNPSGPVGPETSRKVYLFGAASGPVMKKTVYAAMLLSIILTSCVPEVEPYVPSANEEELPIEEQIKQIEEKAKEEARAKLEAQKQEQQPEPPKEKRWVCREW